MGYNHGEAFGCMDIDVQFQWEMSPGSLTVCELEHHHVHSVNQRTEGPCFVFVYQVSDWENSLAIKHGNGNPKKITYVGADFPFAMAIYK